MAQAHGNAGALFSNDIKDNFRSSENFWVVLVHMMYGKLQFPPLREPLKNIFSKFHKVVQAENQYH